ncbi:hypothetical protein HK100_012064 [Physocladia obscura]|uniref:Uncharacterized protein n=1 Tax=Physocladia obscura TaxID=109957 RepID=A0AAD5T0B3_9FUNG|nr:hypothetical protein HK100_012064 [Physocladia obscura]
MPEQAARTPTVRNSEENEQPAPIANKKLQISTQQMNSPKSPDSSDGFSFLPSVRTKFSSRSKVASSSDHIRPMASILMEPIIDRENQCADEEENNDVWMESSVAAKFLLENGTGTRRKSWASLLDSVKSSVDTGRRAIARRSGESLIFSTMQPSPGVESVQEREDFLANNQANDSGYRIASFDFGRRWSKVLD